MNIRVKIVAFSQRAFHPVCWVEGVFLYLKVPPQDIHETETHGVKSDMGAPHAALSQISFNVDRIGGRVLIPMESVRRHVVACQKKRVMCVL